VTTGSQLSRARDSSGVNCIADEELGDTIMVSIEEDAKADDVDAQKQFQSSAQCIVGPVLLIALVLFIRAHTFVQ
jgi:hypothetical protein